ncbi:toxin-antitoxin system YwqK family antitoxin [Hymenobacter negativus]|uniref:Tetratricopeptide repeat protein n=1 Tax=Hymenobacter negativus TaxID=2795026 RepID=A0ABS3QMI7_9BACT|nr:toxin-antitoxin system YwqK family antitoxin [Hymenobacter negativus]MBO2012462.1 tetratricopeptide repeat protein [Hymenobacter negativus]
MSTVIRGAALALLLAAPRLGASQQTPVTWPKPGQLVKEGVELHDKEDYAGAVAKYQAVTPGDSSYATAQSELALSLHTSGKNEEAVAAARRAIALNPFEPQTYNTLAYSQQQLKQVEAAQATYQQALHLFPYSQNLHYNQGVMLLETGQHAAALASLEHALELNPMHPNSHRLLGLLAAQQGQTAHALMSWLLYLALADAGTNSHNMLVQAERLSQGVPVVEDKEKEKPFVTNEAFAELDQLLESKVALQKNYVSKVKFDAAVVKQTQLLVEKFPTEGAADDFWVRVYGPVVAALRKDDNLTAFTYLVLQSANDTKATQWVKSNKNKVESMLRAMLPPLLALRAQQQVAGGSAGQRLAAWYNDGKPEGLGPGSTENDKFKHVAGDWISLDTQGSVDATGRYNAAGQRVGLWKVLRPDGTIEKTFLYNEQGEREGLAREFHANGQPSYDIPYRAGKVEGTVTVFNECGARVSTRSFKNDQLDGPYATYYDNGQLQKRATLHNDKIDGVEEGFYLDGTPEYTTTLANGVKQGAFATYFSDKTLETKGSYDKGEYEGPYIAYFSNGTVREEGKYAKGKRLGVWKTYFRNGKLSVEKSYDEAGELHGIYHDYDETGHLYSDLDYAHGRVTRLRYYDHTGKTLSDQPIKKGLTAIQSLDENGTKYASGSYLEGQMTGEWKWFYRDGAVREISQYAKGDKTGKSEYFHHNGQLERRVRYDANGDEDGYYEQYTKDGQPVTTGYYLAGQRHGQWKDYYANGRVSEEYEYFKGETNGPGRSFEPGGKLTQERLSEFDKLRRITTYDSTGKVLTVVELKPDTKEFSFRYPSGKPLYQTGITCYNSSGPSTWYRADGSIESTYTQVDGRRNGPYKSTFPNGKPDRVGEFRAGRSHGEWLLHYPNGQLLQKGSYRDGEEEGEWTSYFPNGQVEWVQHYDAGELHGLSRRFNPAGELLVEKTFEHGDLVSFRGPDAQAAFQPLANLSGPVATTFPNGKPASSETFDHNLPTGSATFYYASGEVFRRTSFQKGVRTGLLESFYPGGKRMEEEHYLHGELNGRCRYYRPDGTLEREESYRSGERSGPTTYFNAAGKPQRTDVYWNAIVYDGKK